jgi:hypothetical protein
MNADSCLFGLESVSCHGDKLEHIVQEGLGGTLRKPGIICAGCNEHFGRAIDPQICEAFRPIIEIMTPMMPGDLKRRSSFGTSTSGAKVRFGAGGVVELASPLHIPGVDHHTAYFPDRMSEEQVNAHILAKFGPVRKEPSRATSAELAVVLGPVRPTLFDGRVVRAALCDLLELLELASKTGRVPSARIDPLRPLRRIVYSGFKDLSAEYDMYRFANMGRELAALFQPAELAHRLVVSYSDSRNLLTLTASFTDTLPLHFQCPMSLHRRDFTVRYMKALPLGRGDPEPQITDDFVWNDEILKWRPFGTRAGQFNHARSEFFKSFRDAQRRAFYVLDMEHDETPSSWLEEAVDGGISEREAIRELLLSSRYAAHSDVGHIAVDVESLLPDAVARHEMLVTYRSILATVRAAHGFPDWITKVSREHP